MKAAFATNTSPDVARTLLAIVLLLLAYLINGDGSAAAAGESVEDVYGEITSNEKKSGGGFSLQHDFHRRQHHNGEGCGPRGVHLTVGTDPSSSMTVSFASSSSPECGGGGRRGMASVRVGRHPSSLDRTHVEDGPALRYNYTSPLTMKNYTSDYLHHVTVRGLEANTEYFYQCEVSVEQEQAVTPLSETTRRGGGTHRDAAVSLLQSARDRPGGPSLTARGNRELKSRSLSPGLILKGNVSTFVTAPLPGGGLGHVDEDGDRLTFTFAFVGDVGTFPAARSTIQDMIAHSRPRQSRSSSSSSSSSPISSILLVGDVSYANTDQTVWDDWFDMVEPLASRIPLQTAPGNHEIEVDAITEEIFVPYDNHFKMPSLTPGHKEPSPHATYGGSHGKDLVYEHGNAYYAYTYGPARFVVLSSVSATKPGSAQYEWLASELGTVNRTVTPWLFVACHFPLYDTFDRAGTNKQAMRMKRYMEPLFVSHRVNVVFAGHEHAYMRSKPVAFDAVDERGPVYVIIGDGGQAEDRPYRDAARPEEWVARRDNTTHGFGTVEVMNETHAHWRWMRNVDERAGSTVHDAAYIRNQLFL